VVEKGQKPSDIAIFHYKNLFLLHRFGDSSVYSTFCSDGVASKNASSSHARWLKLKEAVINCIPRTAADLLLS
jgi:hypothetical protein